MSATGPLSTVARRLGAAGVGVVAMLAAAAATLDAGPSPHASAVTLIYVGADDCAPCRTWQRDKRPGWLASPEISRIAYREVKSASVLDILKDDAWPDDLRVYRGQLAKGAAVPLWLVVRDQQVVAQAWGGSQWDTTVLPRVKSLVR